MMTRNGWIALAGLACLALAFFAGRAHASDLPPGITCPDIRAAIASVARQTGKTMKESAVIVEAMALSGGATRQQVEAARRCLTRD